MGRYMRTGDVRAHPSDQVMGTNAHCAGGLLGASQQQRDGKPLMEGSRSNDHTVLCMSGDCEETCDREEGGESFHGGLSDLNCVGRPCFYHIYRGTVTPSTYAHG